MQTIRRIILGLMFILTLAAMPAVAGEEWHYASIDMDKPFESKAEVFDHELILTNCGKVIAIVVFPAKMQPGDIVIVVPRPDRKDADDFMQAVKAQIQARYKTVGISLSLEEISNKGCA